MYKKYKTKKQNFQTIHPSSGSTHPPTSELFSDLFLTCQNPLSGHGISPHISVSVSPPTQSVPPNSETGSRRRYRQSKNTYVCTIGRELYANHANLMLISIVHFVFFLKVKRIVYKRL